MIPNPNITPSENKANVRAMQANIEAYNRRNALNLHRGQPMTGHLPESKLYGGFQNRDLRAEAAWFNQPSRQTPIMRALSEVGKKIEAGEAKEIATAIERGEIGDMNALLLELSKRYADVERVLSTSTANLPIRENLEAEAKDLVPKDTPVRNSLPRTAGAGLSSVWKIITSLGGGWSTSLDQPGSAAAIQSFMQETGAPASFDTVFASRLAPYKIMGAFRSITGFAAAAGATYANYMADERTRAVQNLMLNEENAIINGDATSTAAPWGDGANALAFSGIIKSTVTGNGVPSAQIQATVGSMTFAFLDSQLRHLWIQGITNPKMLLNSLDALSITHIATASGGVTMYRILPLDSGSTAASAIVSHYIHPETGEPVPILVSRFVPQGTVIIYGLNGPDGTPSMDMDVLPQVQLPALAPNEQIQGYVLQELAPTTAAPQVYPFIITVYETFRLKIGPAFTIGTGVTTV